MALLADQSPELKPLDDEAEKKKDYRRAVLIQIIFLALALLADDGLRLLGVNSRGLWFDALFHLVAAIYLVALCDMLRNYTRSVWLVRATYLILGLAFALLVTINILFSFSPETRNSIQLVAHFILAAVQIEVIAFAIIDLFRSTHRADDRLWGSACIYFMLGFAFASIYATVLMLNPKAFGLVLPPDAYLYFETIYLSFNALVGLDTSYPDATRLVRNLALMQGLWSQLYLVLLIGRLLTPSEPKLPSNPDRMLTPSE